MADDEIMSDSATVATSDASTPPTVMRVPEAIRDGFDALATYFEEFARHGGHVDLGGLATKLRAMADLIATGGY